MGCRITYRLMTNPAEIPTPSTMEMSLINSEPELLMPRAKTKSALTPPSVDPPPTGVELYMKLIRRGQTRVDSAPPIGVGQPG